jgi:uncharacterized protein
MKIQRQILSQLRRTIQPGKVVVLYGPRQVGKTTLVQDLLAETSLAHTYINADELVYREALGSQNRRTLGDLLGHSTLLVIDEAQRVPDIGLNLKILVDNYPHVAIVATGSSSFDLTTKVSEPLTGRKLTLTLYPASYSELAETFGAFEARTELERWLIWGGYPSIVTAEPGLRERQLGELVGSYLYRDILELDGVRRAEKIVNLLRLLAFQIGQEVSITELATTLALGRLTVERYLDLLEKVFVIFRTGGLSRNLRKEVTKTARYYFYDNGVRNSLIQNFNRLNLRNDIGQLWENYLMVERRKANQYAGRSANTYFWRTYDQKELDYVEEREGRLFGYEFKWQGQMRSATQREFLAAYPGAEVTTITRDNFTDFLC